VVKDVQEEYAKAAAKAAAVVAARRGVVQEEKGTQGVKDAQDAQSAARVKKGAMFAGAVAKHAEKKSIRL